MRIDYNILWFEDDKGSFDAKKESVKEIVEGFSFNFPEPRNEVNGDNLEKINLEDYDLIMVDLKLERENGAKLIERIRAHEVYTEIIFYSSEGEKAVREEIRKHEIDGVYCADRKDDEFRDKVEKVIKTTIKKVQDINNMRGLIMSATSDFDASMKEIINSFYETFPDDQKTVVTNQIFHEVGKSVESKNKSFNQFHEKMKIHKLIKDNVLFDAQKKAAATQFIIDQIKDEHLNDLKEGKFLEAYSSEVIKIRNDFAHVSDCINENGKRVLRSHSGDKEFTDELCIEARKNLIKYLDGLQSIKETLTSEAKALKS